MPCAHTINYSPLRNRSSSRAVLFYAYSLSERNLTRLEARNCVDGGLLLVCFGRNFVRLCSCFGSSLFSPMSDKCWSSTWKLQKPIFVGSTTLWRIWTVGGASGSRPDECWDEVRTFDGGWKVGLWGGNFPCGNNLLWIPAITDFRSSEGLLDSVVFVVLAKNHLFCFYSWEWQTRRYRCWFRLCGWDRFSKNWL